MLLFWNYTENPAKGQGSEGARLRPQGEPTVQDSKLNIYLYLLYKGKEVLSKRLFLNNIIPDETHDFMPGQLLKERFCCTGLRDIM